MILRLGGQWRSAAAGGMAGGVVFLGWDMAAALAVGRALDVPEAVVAEFLPDIEPIAVKAMNRHLGERS